MSVLPTSVRMGAHRSSIVLEEAPPSLDAIPQFFEALPAVPGAALVLAVPADAETTGMTAEALARHTCLPITTVTAPTSVVHNHVYLSPPGRPLTLRRDVLVPDHEEPTERGGAPIVHVVQTTDQWERHSEAGGERMEALHLAVHPVPASGTDRPLVVVKGQQAGLRPDENGGVEPLQTTRTERLERELRETRRELRDMVQKYEGVQRRLRKANETLQKKNELLEERAEQVRSLSEAVTMAEENERERLSHVLHDDLQQVLYAVRTKIDLVVEQEELDERGKTLLSRSLDLLDDGIETTRTLASALNPPMENSLWDTLEWLGIQMQEAYGLSVEMCARNYDRTTDKTLQVLVVRLVRELLFNVVKHAGTQEAVLTLTESERQLHVVVEDDGEGFDPDELEESEGGFGLASVRRRLELVGGSFEVDAAPGEGTRVRLGVPFQFEEAGDETGVSGGDGGNR